MDDLNNEKQNTNSTDESLNTEEQCSQKQVDTEKVPYDRFKSVNDAKKAAEKELEQLRAQIAEREEAEAKEAGQYKELYEAEISKREAAERAKNELELDNIKSRKLIEAGFSGERLEKAKAFVSGNSEDEISSQIALFTELIPAEKYADPSINAPGGQRTETKTTKDKAEEAGREAARRLFKRK